jgi:hypothetical protein
LDFNKGILLLEMHGTNIKKKNEYQCCVCAWRSPPPKLPISEILSIKLARIMIHCYRTVRVHKFVLVQVNMF